MSPPEAPIPKQQFNVYLPPELIKDLKHHCIERGGSLSNLVEKIIQEYLQKQQKGK
jgi:hypothetical protein